MIPSGYLSMFMMNIGKPVHDETTWEPMTEMVEVDENGNDVSSESEDTSDNGAYMET